MRWSAPAIDDGVETNRLAGGRSTWPERISGKAILLCLAWAAMLSESFLSRPTAVVRKSTSAFLSWSAICTSARRALVCLSLNRGIVRFEEGVLQILVTLKVKPIHAHCVQHRFRARVGLNDTLAQVVIGYLHNQSGLRVIDDEVILTCGE